MRKFLEGLSFLALLWLAVETIHALFGPHKLSGQIPVHFNAAGQATGYASPLSLLGLPLGALILYSLMSMVARRPGAFNFPTRVTPINRPRLEALAVQMISWLKAEVVFLFAWIQHFTVAAARSGQGKLPAIFMPVTLGVVFATIGIYFALFRRSSSS